MKKILLLVFLFVLGKMSYSQGYPLTQNLGSDSTIVVSKGALQSRLIPIVITDTNAANAQRLKSYPGAQLYTTAGDFYIRNSNATKWILVSSGSSGSVNIYTADGTLTGNRTLTGANNNLTFTGLNKFTVSTGDTTLFNTNTFDIKGVGGVLNVEGTAAGTTSSLTLKTASDGNWTISTGQVNFNSGDLRFYDNDNGANRMIIKPSGNVGIGTETPDSLLTVNGGVYIGGGIRAPGLPTALGTKALRINAQGQISVADTTLGGGTVISVATNDGSGITGGPITVSGTLAIDTTNVIATKASVSSGLAGKLNISDTASMLAPYLRAIDTASLSNRINLKLNISDTASMLGNYLNNVGYGLSKVGQVASADSATLSAYYLRRKDSLTTTNPLGYVTKKILADTAAAIRSSSASGFVPYTGATQNVDLGQFGLKTKYVEFDTSSQAVADRRLQWSNDEGTLQFGMTNGATITQRLGLEQFARVKNVQGSQINKGQAVYIYGASGDRASVKLADNRDDSTSSKTLGVAAEDIPINGVGLVGTFGQVGNLNLSAFSPGNILYLDSVPGQLTATKPQAPYNLVFIGVVERANSGNGLLFVNPQNGYELEELHNVLITSPVLNNAILAYDSVAKLWKDTTLNGIGGVTGSGTTNRISKFTSSGVIGNSSIADSSSTESMSIASDGDIAMGSTGANILNSKLRIRSNATSSSPLVVNNSSDNILFQLAENSSNGALVQLFDASNNNRIVLSTNAASSFTGGSLSVGTAFPDSMFQVTQGAYFQRGVRMSGLPSAPGTKALRIDASGTISIADTLIDAGGTVTSVATNNGTGITGGTITTSGTLAIDTAVISTRAWRQKGIDSVAALINNNISGTTNYIPRFSSANAISNSIMRESGTRIGINTSPFYNLDILEAGLATIGAGTTNNKIVISGTDNGGSISTNNTTYISFAPFQTEAMRITSSGVVNMGANFTNNSNKLNVGGSATIGYSTNVVGPTNGLSVNGSVGIGLNGVSTDSALSVLNGAYFQRGVRMSGLPTAAGTRALRVDANGTLSVSDTLANGISGTGTTNYIPKFTGTNSIGNSNLQTDASGNLGLGVTPSAWQTDVKAIQIGDVGSNICANNAAYSGGNNVWINNNSFQNSSVQDIYTRTATAGQYQINGNVHIWRIAPSGTAGNTISFTQAMTLDASGNLGIGTTSPALKLVVAGPDDGTMQIRMQGTAAPTYYWEMGREAMSTGDFRINESNAGSVSNRFTIKPGGNVGIGTTSPSGKTEISGSASGTTFVALNLRNTDEVVGSDASMYFSTGSGALASTNITGLIRSSVTQANPSALKGNLKFYVNSGDNIIEGMQLDASGNLGLGVTPSAWDATLSKAIQLNGGSLWGYSTSQINLLQNAFYNSSGDIAYVNSASASAYRQISGVHSWYTAPSGTAGNAISFTQAMTLTASGNLGIGTTSPSNILHLYKASEPEIYLQSSGATFRTGLNSDNEYFIYSANAKAIYFANNGSERMRITSAGNVGIGTTSPNAILHTLSSSANAGIIATTSNTSFYTEYRYNSTTVAGYIGNGNGIVTGGGAGNFGVRAEADLLFAAGGNSERMRITSAGNVGIGTTSPSYPLEIRKSTGAWSTSDDSFGAVLGVYYNTANVAATQNRFRILANQDAVYLDGYDAFPIIFRNNGNTERMRITSGGEVYIAGTTDQGAYNLQVNGTGVWGAGAYVDGSDSALKKNVQPLDNSLEIIKQMRPVTFEYQPFYSKDTATQTGFIAQELQQVLADKVYKNGVVKEGGAYLGVAYQSIIPLLVKSIQELEAQVQELKSQLNNR